MQKHAGDEQGPNDLTARARQVLDLLRAEAPQIEVDRQVTAKAMAALHEQRLFRALLPRSLGGDEASPLEFCKMIETIATADASTGWCLSQGGGCAMGAAFLKPEAQRKFFGAPNAVLAWGAGIQGKAIKAPGGYRVTGKWTFASGSRHATLLGGHSYVFDADSKPVMRPGGKKQLDRTALFWRHQATVHDVWHVVGLKGTGSDTFEVNDLFVPEDDTIDRENPAELTEPAPLFKFSATVVYGAGFSGLMLGIARGMIDDLRELAMTKTPRAAPSSLRESPVFQTQIAILEGRLRAMQAYVHKTCEDIYEEVARTGDMSLEQRVNMKLATTLAINEGVAIATEAYRLAGQSAIHEGATFQRRMRDALTASQQTQARGTNYLTIGRVLMGLEADNNMFL